MEAHAYGLCRKCKLWRIRSTDNAVLDFFRFIIHRLLYSILCTIVMTDTNFILTLTSNSGFVLNFDFRKWISSWIPKFICTDLFNNYPNYSNFIYCGRISSTLFHYWLRWSLSLESGLLSIVISAQFIVKESVVYK